jgi:arylformamidase
MNAPSVWRDMTQAELDAAYDQIKYAPNQPQIVKRFASNSEAFRARCGAEMFVHAGAHFVVPDFAWVQDADGNLHPVAEQVRRALAWVYRHAKELGGDPERIYVSGHSSGGHLAAVLLTTDWQKDFGLPADVIKGGLCCSGIYELKPVGLSSRSIYLKITADVEQALSPHRNLAQVRAPLLLAYGSLETPEFQRQSVDFFAALR